MPGCQDPTSLNGFELLPIGEFEKSDQQPQRESFRLSQKQSSAQGRASQELTLLKVHGLGKQRYEPTPGALKALSKSAQQH